MNKSIIEYVTGILIIVAAGYFLHSAYYKAEQNNNRDEYYNIIANFNNIDGINIGSEVRIAGIKVGQVISKKVDEKTYQANLTLNVENRIKIPLDSSAKIASDGFLGGKFISISPGSDDSTLPAGGSIEYTQSSVNLETLIGKMIFSKEE
jgi:phospholipid/cholesterol/gamma-HCH transport system substrate-binding protein